MKTSILTLILATLLPTMATAQDDMYYTPSKAEKKAKKERKVPNGGSTYYAGMNMSVDEYNRRAKKYMKSYAVDDSLIYSNDSVAPDVITFTPASLMDEVARQQGEPEVKYIYVHDTADFSLCRYLSRFDNFFWYSRFYGPGWCIPWLWGIGDPWYNPWFWDDYIAWYGPYWYDPYWYNPWYTYPWYTHPWAYGHNWYNHGYYAGGGGHHSSGNHGIAASRPGRGGTGGVIVRSTAGSNVNNHIANRNGGGVTRYTNRGESRGWSSGRYNSSTGRGGNNSNGYTSRSNSYSSGSSSTGFSSSGSSSTGFSGGGSSGGGGGFSSGGGHYSGGGYSSGGGGHTGGRR